MCACTSSRSNRGTGSSLKLALVIFKSLNQDGCHAALADERRNDRQPPAVDANSGPLCRLLNNVMVRHPAGLVAAVPTRVFRPPEPGLLIGDLDPDAAAWSDVEYLSLPHSRTARDVRAVAEGDDLSGLEP